MQSLAVLRTLRSVVQALGALRPLTAQDAFGLSVEIVRSRLGRVRYRRGARLDLRDLMQADLDAVAVVAALHPPSAAASGFFASVYTPSLLRWEIVIARLYDWRQDVLHPALERSVHGGASDHDRVVAAVHEIASNAEFAQGESTLQALRCGRAELTRKQRAPVDEQALTPMSLASDYRLMDNGEGRLVPGLFVGRDGRIRLGKRLVRDELRKVSTRPPIGLRNADASMDDVGLEPVGGGSVLDAVEAYDAVRAVTAIAAELAGEAKPGSARRLVMSNLTDLLSGGVRLGDLARRGAFSTSTLSEELTRARAVIGRRLAR